MNLKVIAVKKTPVSTISKLFINDKFECYVLEDTDRGLSKDMSLSKILSIKVPSQTAIPSGTYNVIIDFSNRFKCEMPLIQNVPGYEGIRIHSGNYPKDTEGCLLLGTQLGVDEVLFSRIAFSSFFTKLQKALKTEKVSLSIIR